MINYWESKEGQRAKKCLDHIIKLHNVVGYEVWYEDLLFKMDTVICDAILQANNELLVKFRELVDDFICYEKR